MDVVFEINEQRWNYIFYLLNNDISIVIATKTTQDVKATESRKHQFNL